MKKSLITLGLLAGAATSAYGHHARCVTDTDDFMTCGAHFGIASFNLTKAGSVTTDTKELVLCNQAGKQVSDLSVSWVESDDEKIHFDMKDVVYKSLSNDCILIGKLDFTPHKDFIHAEQNAWRISISVEGAPLEQKTSLYVEAMPAESAPVE